MTDVFICGECLPDRGFQKLIQEDGEEETCSFCGKQNQCFLCEDLIEHLMICVREHYTDEPEGVYDAEEGVFREQEEPEYIVSDMLENDVSNPILEMLCEGFEDHIWTRKNPYDEEYGWDRFSKHVKYRKRFFFYHDKSLSNEPVYGSPIDLLKKTLIFCRKHLISELPVGKKLFRSRLTSKENEESEKNSNFFDPPSSSMSNSNRMNPRGIPYWYLADSRETAFEETKDQRGRYKIGEFEVSKQLKILDLTNIPKEASFFDPDKEKRDEINEIFFLRNFISAISKKTHYGDQAYLDYVPSQIFSEFIREKIQDVVGIAYPSTKTGGINIAFFPNSDENFEKDNNFNILNFVKLIDTYKWNYKGK